MKQVVLDALNQQITREIYSANLYLSMSGYFASKNLGGMAKWMELQANEEMGHAMKFFHYIIQRGALPIIGTINAPQFDWASPLKVFEDAYHHETLVTGWINELVVIAKAENDFATDNLLQWFTTEQVEEESTAMDIVEKMKMIGDNPQGLFMIDTTLGQRTASGAGSAAKS